MLQRITWFSLYDWAVYDVWWFVNVINANVNKFVVCSCHPSFWLTCWIICWIQYFTSHCVLTSSRKLNPCKQTCVLKIMTPMEQQWVTTNRITQQHHDTHKKFDAYYKHKKHPSRGTRHKLTIIKCGVVHDSSVYVWLIHLIIFVEPRAYQHTFETNSLKQSTNKYETIPKYKQAKIKHYKLVNCEMHAQHRNMKHRKHNVS